MHCWMNVSDSGDCHCENTDSDLNEFCTKYCDLYNNYLNELTRQPNLKEVKLPKEAKLPMEPKSGKYET